MFGHRNVVKHGAVALSLALLALAGASRVQAEPASRMRVFGTRGVIETVGTTPTFVRIDEGGESFSFETTAQRTDLHITFGASCKASSQPLETRAGMTWILDGQPIAPTEVGRGSLCASANGRIPPDAPASRTVVVPGVGPGPHVLEVQTGSEDPAVQEGAHLASSP